MNREIKLTLTSVLTRYIICTVATLSLTGCGSKKATITGTVSYRGMAVTSGQVSFIPPDGFPVTVEIQPDGSYEAPKIMFGKAIVTVIQRPNNLQSPAEIALTGRNKNQDLPPPVASLPESLLPIIYLNPNTSPLRCLAKKTKVDFPILLVD